MGDYYKLIEADSYKTLNTGFLTFCSTSTPDNILMWSHYGDSHKGTCIKYPMVDILKTIQNDHNIGICFYGKIKYKNDRPIFSLPFTTYRFLDIELAILRFNLICMFQKYKDWVYENEYRFIILLNDINKNVQGYGTSLKGSELILGNKFPIGKYQNYLSRFFRTYQQLNLSNAEYKLL